MLRFRKWLAGKLWAQQVNVVTEHKVTYSHRLTPELFKQLEAKLPGVYVDDNTTEIRSGYMLGIRQVLDVLSKDFTVTPP